MGRPSAKKGGGRTPASAGKGGGGRRKSAPLSDDMYDEVDAFHNARDKINLAGSASDEGSGSEEDAPVLDTGDSEDDDESGEESEDLDEDIRRGGLIGRMAREKKALNKKLKTEDGEDSDGDDDDGDDGKDERWGQKKRDYYSADNVDYEIDSDEEAPAEEEAEALALQREQAGKLRAEDYEQSDDEEEEGSEDSEEESDDEDTLEAKAKASKGKGEKKKGGRGGGGDAVVEVVKKDKGALSREEQLAALSSDAPELLALLTELQQGLGEVRDKVGPLLQKVQGGDLATQEGVSYLESKHLLLLSYCINIVFYLLLKAEGRPVRDHPVLARLVQIRAYVEKIRPIDKKLAYQVEKLLAAAEAPAPVANGAAHGAFASERMEEGDGAMPAAGAGGKADALSFGPNPGRLVGAGGGAGADGGGDGVYRPPKMTPASMGGVGGEEDGEGGRRKKGKKLKGDRSTLLRELNAEAEGLPEELRDAEREVGGLSQQEKTRRHMRDTVEEDMFMRVPLSKEERKRRRKEERLGLSARLDDFGDDLHDIVEGVSELDGAAKKRGKLSDTLGLDGGLAKKARGRSGDEELPTRQSLGDRRAKYQPPGAPAGRDFELSYTQDGEMLDGSELRDAPVVREKDATYVRAEEAGLKKKKAREARNAKPKMTNVPQPDAEVDDGNRRGVGMDIEKNRGLTPHRKRADKNPRKKHRTRFEQAKVRRKGAITDVKDGAGGGGYGGEATGIKSRITKSTRL